MPTTRQPEPQAPPPVPHSPMPAGTTGILRPSRDPRSACNPDPCLANAAPASRRQRSGATRAAPSTKGIPDVALRRTHCGRIRSSAATRIEPNPDDLSAELSGRYFVRARGSRDSGLRAVDAVSVLVGREESSRFADPHRIDQPVRVLRALGPWGRAHGVMNRSY